MCALTAWVSVSTKPQEVCALTAWVSVSTKHQEVCALTAWVSVSTEVLNCGKELKVYTTSGKTAWLLLLLLLPLPQSASSYMHKINAW